MRKGKKQFNLLKRLYVCVASFLFATVMFGATAYSQDVLCPKPSNIATTAPADLAQVQSDIDRLTLCVERARLLADLDKSIEDREGKKKQTNSILDPIQPIMPSADDLTKVIQNQNLGIQKLPELPPAAGDSVGSQSKKTEQDSKWKVRRIWGAKGNTKAQLVKDNGVVATVVENDVLPDGYVVVSLSTIGVTIKKDGKSKDLDWAVVEVENKE